MSNGRIEEQLLELARATFDPDEATDSDGTDQAARQGILQALEIVKAELSATLIVARQKMAEQAGKHWTESLDRQASDAATSLARGRYHGLHDAILILDAAFAPPVEE